LTMKSKLQEFVSNVHSKSATELALRDIKNRLDNFLPASNINMSILEQTGIDCTSLKFQLHELQGSENTNFKPTDQALDDFKQKLDSTIETLHKIVRSVSWLEPVVKRGFDAVFDQVADIANLTIIDSFYQSSTFTDTFPGLPQCTRNPSLQHLTDEDFIKAEEFALQRRLLTRQLVREYKSKAWESWEVFIPVIPDLCEKNFVQIGKEGDGDLICGLEGMDETDCVIFSFGPPNDWSFEQNVLESTQKCRTITFDCNAAWYPPEQISDRATFKKICWNAINTDAGDTQNLQTMLLENNVRHVALLKMNIKGLEWSYFFDMFDNVPLSSSQHLPEQIVVTIHGAVHLDLNPTIDWLAKLVDIWYDVGYRVIDRRLNPQGCYDCFEVTLLRVRC